MATNNAPKHDFAPAWLKIPSQDSTKPSGSKQGKRFPPGQSGKFRHHSVDDDYYAYYNAPYNYYNGYGYPEKFGMHYSSQPSLLRSAGQRDSKYQHPHARYSNGQQVNVGYSPYYEFLPSYDYYGNDAYYNNNNYPQGSRNGNKRGYYEKEGRSNSKEGKDKEDKKDKENEKEKPFIDDFPSLNGDLEKQSSKGSKHVNGTGTGVWDNPPIGKGSINKGDDNSDTSQSKVLRDTKIFKNLVPNKSSMTRHMTRMNGSYPRDQVPYTSIKPPTPSGYSPGFSKEGSGLSPTPPIDILNTPFITQPKTLSDKKRSFLKTLRQEDSEKHHDKRHVRKSNEGELVNGIDSLGIEEDSHLLSSSLEAEQRLLREMGWNEADQEDYEITEDEKKEFQNLSKQVQQQRNGIVRSIPKTWSPKHIPIYQPPAHELNETLSSSDSDSDDAEF